jgi:hypothetical protein
MDLLRLNVGQITVETAVPPFRVIRAVNSEDQVSGDLLNHVLVATR